jgi:hypothetical protein
VSRPEEKTPFWLLAVAWTVVAIPLAWGVYQTAAKSMPLFRVSASTGAPAPPAVHR